MAFVNEWISQEDIEKYRLIELCDSYRKNDDKYTAVKEPRRKIDWTIDREREIWLMKIASITDPNFHLPSPTPEAIFILHHQGQNIEVRLWMESISMDPKEIPFLAGWKYLGMHPESIEGADEEALKAIVCETLHVYKQLGLRGKRTEVTEIKLIDFEGGE